MRNRHMNIAASALLFAAIATLAPISCAQQAGIARLPNGKPDLSGNWSIAANLNDISANIVRIGFLGPS